MCNATREILAEVNPRFGLTDHIEVGVLKDSRESACLN